MAKESKSIVISQTQPRKSCAKMHCYPERKKEKRKKKKEKRRDMQSFVHAFIHSFIRWSAGSLPCPSPLSRPSLARLAAIVEHTHVSFMHSTTVVALLFFLFSFFFSFLFLFCESEFLFHGLKSRG